MGRHKQHPGIYVIRNTTTGAFYIGSTAYLEVRERHHRRALARGEHGNPRLQRAFDKYGPAAFVFEVIAEVDAADAQSTEGRLLARLVGHPLCYNMKRDPHGGRTGLPHTAAARAKIGAAHKGKPRSPEYRAKIAASKRGITPNVSAEGKARAAEATRRAWLGRTHTADAIAKMRETQRTKTPAQLAALADVQRGNVGRSHTVSDEARAKMSAAKKGKKWPADVTARRNDAIRAAYARKKAAAS